jgi:hypothetical protein
LVQIVGDTDCKDLNFIKQSGDRSSPFDCEVVMPLVLGVLDYELMLGKGGLIIQGFVCCRDSKKAVSMSLASASLCH